ETSFSVLPPCSPWLRGGVRVPRRRSSAPRVDQLDLEDQRRSARDHRRASGRTISQVCRDLQLALAALVHRRDALVPALDDVALAERERDRLGTLEGGVELR